MRDNVVSATNGADVYINQIYFFADEFINDECNGDSEKVHDNFLAMIFYIADHIEKPNHDDIELLDKMFDAYVRLCVKYGVLPTLECFGFLTKINRTTFTDWANGEYRKSSSHAVTVKRWFDICKSFVVDKLHNTGGASINLIFVAKSAYRIREVAAELPESHMMVPQLSRAEIAARFQTQTEFQDAPNAVLDVDNL